MGPLPSFDLDRLEVSDVLSTCAGNMFTMASPFCEPRSLDSATWPIPVREGPTPSSSSMLASGWLWLCTFFLNKALRNEYPRLRDVGESGERLPALLGERDGSRGLEVLPRCPDPSPSSPDDISRVLTVKSGVPGLLPDTELFPCCTWSSLAAQLLLVCPAPCLSTSVENRTRGATSEDSREVAGRDAFSTAEVRAAGVALVGL
jgi:hypothetical protein